MIYDLFSLMRFLRQTFRLSQTRRTRIGYPPQPLSVSPVYVALYVSTYYPGLQPNEINKAAFYAFVAVTLLKSES